MAAPQVSQFYAHLIGTSRSKKTGLHRALPSTWGSNASIVAVETLGRVREFEAGGALDGDKCTVYCRQHSHSLVHLNVSGSGCVGARTLSHARPFSRLLTWAR